MNNKYDEIINKNLLVRRINICACNVIDEKDAKKEVNFSQLDLFSDNNKVLEEKKEEWKIYSSAVVNVLNAAVC